MMPVRVHECSFCAHDGAWYPVRFATGYPRGTCVRALGLPEEVYTFLGGDWPHAHPRVTPIETVEQLTRLSDRATLARGGIGVRRLTRIREALAAWDQCKADRSLSLLLSTRR